MTNFRLPNHRLRRNRTKPMLQRVLALVFVSLVLLGCESRTEFAGGTRLKFRFDPTESAISPAALRSELVSTIEKRLDLAGVRQFRVQSEERNRISVNVPSTVSDLDQIKRLVTMRGRLTFHVVSEEGVLDANLDYYENEERAYRDALGKWRERVREWNVKKNKEPAFSEPRPPKPSPPQRIVRTDSHGQRMLLENTGTGRVTGAILEDAYIISRDEHEQPALGIRFTSEDGARVGAMTEENMERWLAIVLDGTIRSIPVINTRIERRAQIFNGRFSSNELQDLVVVLQSGPLPVSFEFAGDESLSTVEGE